MSFDADVLIVGAGAAGLTTALQLADTHKVLLITKEDLKAGSTTQAQGGVAAVTHEGDSLEAHVEDTLNTGFGLCDPAIVRMVVGQAHQVVERLVELGVPFDRDTEGFQLANEGAHSFPRVLHVADETGQAIAATLIRHVNEHPNIEVRVNRVAIDLVTNKKLGKREDKVLGMYVYDRGQQIVETLAVPCVVLATGGASKVYKYTSNPAGATGDGIAIAARAGCRISNMEFNQFHPTCLYHPSATSFLISEAVRGEGGQLILPNGDSFMHRFDEREELASRDVVARAIDFEMKRLGVPSLYLDVSQLSPTHVQERFPKIYEKLLSVGIDMTREPIPIVPAAHYTCGGVFVDRDGLTDIEGLYAVGETACTGLHGANRLASNSLLECFVFANAAARHIQENWNALKQTDVVIPKWDESQVTESDEDVVLSQDWGELRGFMWNYVGIVRTNQRLERASRRIDMLKREVHEYYSKFRVNSDLLELRNLILVAELIVKAAQWREESRGLHFNKDYPDTSPNAMPSVIRPAMDPLDVF